jgi:hypothetical protein
VCVCVYLKVCMCACMCERKRMCVNGCVYVCVCASRNLCSVNLYIFESLSEMVCDKFREKPFFCVRTDLLVGRFP